MKIALLGCGAVSQILYKEAFKALEQNSMGNVKLFAVVDLDRKNAEPFLKEFKDCIFDSDINHFLNTHTPDAVINALPHNLHTSVNLACIQKGIHVLCEKPLSLNSNEADQIESALLNAPQVTFAVGFFRRFFPSLNLIKTIIDQKTLGNILSFEFLEGEFYSWPAASASFFSRKTAGGGALIDGGSHTMDILQWWFGKPSSLSDFDDCISTSGVEADCELILEYSHFSGHIRLSRTTNMPNIYRIEFEKGTIEWEYDQVESCKLKLKPLNETTTLTQFISETVPSSVPAFSPFLEAFYQQLLHFTKACKKDSSANTISVKEGRKSIDLIDSAYKAKAPLNLSWLSAEASEDLAIDQTLKYAVIGAGGFIGSSLIEHLFLHPSTTSKFRSENLLPIIHRYSGGAAFLSRFGCNLTLANVLDKQSLATALKSSNIIFYCAVGDEKVTVDGLKNTLEVALKNKIKRIVYLSTAMVHGFTPPAIVSETTKFSAPNWYPYAQNKIEAEKLIDSYRSRGLDCVVLRPMLVVGPRSSFWTLNLAKEIAANRGYLVNGGIGPCNTVYIQHLLDAMLLSAHHPMARNQTYLIDDEFDLSWKDYFQDVCDRIGYPIEKVTHIDNSHRSSNSDSKMSILPWLKSGFKNETIRTWINQGPGITRFKTILPNGLKEQLKSTLRKPVYRATTNTSVIFDQELIAMQNYPGRINASKIRAQLGWKPRFSLEQTQRLTGEYLRFAGLYPKTTHLNINRPSKDSKSKELSL